MEDKTQAVLPKLTMMKRNNRVTKCYSVKTGQVSTIVHRGRSVSESSLDSNEQHTAAATAATFNIITDCAAKHVKIIFNFQHELCLSVQSGTMVDNSSEKQQQQQDKSVATTTAAAATATATSEAPCVRPRVYHSQRMQLLDQVRSQPKNVLRFGFFEVLPRSKFFSSFRAHFENWVYARIYHCR